MESNCNISLPNRIWLLFVLCFRYVLFWTFPTSEEHHYLSLGKVYFDLNNLRKAIKLFLKSEESHRGKDLTYSKYNWFYLAYSYFGLGDYRNAADYFHRLLKYDINSEELLIYAKTCHELLSEDEKALEYSRSLLGLSSNDAVWYYGCSRLLYKLGRREEALEFLRTALGLVDDPIRKKLIEAALCRFDYKYEDSIGLLDDTIILLEMTPSSEDEYDIEDVYRQLYRAHKENGNIQKAIEILELNQTKYPDSPWPMNALSKELIENNIDLNRALKLIECALDYLPDCWRFLDTKGLLMLKMNRPAEAVKLFELSFELNPGNKEALEHLATASREFNHS